MRLEAGGLAAGGLATGGLALLVGAVFWWLRFQSRQGGCDQMNGGKSKKGGCDELEGGPSDLSESTKMDTKFDVFLNHLGPDTKTFAKILHTALQHAGCEPFLDVESLVAGENAFASINDTLSGVLVHVAIFSPRYAESEYCLNELCDMLSSKKPIIVVFYNVEPENLRRTSEGPYAQAFEKHLKRGLGENVKRWQSALKEAATITGVKHREHIDDIEKLKEEVVARILSVLPSPVGSPSFEHQVGISESLNFLSKKLHAMGDYPGVIGIHGIGEIGRTMLASELYYRECTSFKHHYFLMGVKQYEGKDMENLQVKMVSELLHVDLKNVKEQREHFFEMISKVKVFLVIDDIRDVKQFGELLPNLENLMSGSRVVITSGDRCLLQKIMRNLPELQQHFYPMRELNEKSLMILLVQRAFQRKSLLGIGNALHDHIRDIARPPFKLGHLSSLKEVDFSHCKNLVRLPETFGCLSNLEKLDMDGCGQFETTEGESIEYDYELFKNEIYEDIKKIDRIQEVPLDLVDTKTLFGSQDMLILSFFDEGKNSFEFYFKNREDMAYIVGVGLNYGKVILEGRKISIKEILEEDWDQRWKMVEIGSSIRMKLLKLEAPLSSLATQGHTHLDVEISEEVPLLWKFAKYFTLRELIAKFFTKEMYVKYTNCAGTSSSGFGKSDGGASSSNSQHDQGAKSVGGSFKYIPPEQSKHGEDKNDDDQNDEIKGEESNHLDKHGVVKATVSVQLLEGGDFENMVDDLKPLKGTIYPKLKYEFINKCGDKRIRTVVGKTQFRMVWDYHSHKPSWYHQKLGIRYGLSDKHNCYGELGRSSYQHLDMQSGKYNTRVSSTHEDKKGKEGTLQGRIGGKCVVEMRGQIEGKITSEAKIGSVEERSIELPLDLTPRGLFVNSSMNKHVITCLYQFPSHNNYDSFSHPQFIDHDLRFEGTWHPMDKNGSSPRSVEYTFRAWRTVQHVSNEGKEHVQEYVKTMLVNHSMTHLDNKVYKLQESRDSEGKTVLKIKRKNDLPNWGNEILIEPVPLENEIPTERVPLSDDNRSTNNGIPESLRKGNSQGRKRYSWASK